MKWIKLFENFNEITNIVIIGGGISSLYSAYLLKKNYPKIKYTIIEKSDECGGRVKMSNIGGVKLHTGAYFTRVDKDKILGKTLSKILFKDPVKASILSYFEKGFFALVETTKQIKNYFNYTVPKNNRRVF